MCSSVFYPHLAEVSSVCGRPAGPQVSGPGSGPGSASDHQFKLSFCIFVALL